MAGSPSAALPASAAPAFTIARRRAECARTTSLFLARSTRQLLPWFQWLSCGHLDLLVFLQAANALRLRLIGIHRRPRGIANFTDVQVAARIHGEAMW